ncbi:peroxiredoxin [Flavobacterium sp. CS20]|uniref:peroxiredoxin family protein n=1 Tax=Flavobacterium sp. CS20 TaxID=2775246 RepID=UPI001B39DBDE|nr:redoxin domain-containing protein [Flavobacterium sp. CS20]QTY28108.1 redoxin domain-containing protein [Flavobacterium sp. CS20]
MKKIILLIALTSTSVIFAQDYPKSLPDFEISNQNNETFTQDDVSQDSYAYFIYFNPTCGHCKTAFKTLNLHVEDLKNTKFKLYPVSAKNDKDTHAFFENYAPKLLALNNVQILLDDNYKFADTFFVKGYPTAFLYDKNQKLVKVYNGESKIMGFMDEIK